MAKKQNPVLAAFEAKLEKEYRGRLECNSEIDMITMLIAGSRLGFLGEKRASLLIEELIDVKMQLAENLLQDAKDDKELLYIKADLARTVKQILGPDGWEKHKTLFKLLQEYWDD